MKLTYLAKHVLARDPDKDNPIPTFLNIGSLVGDKLLEPGQAQMAYNILGMREAEFASIPPSDREIFLRGASSFVNTIRIQVFAALVEKSLSKKWSVAHCGQRRGQRDLLVQSPDRENVTQHHMIPTFALTTKLDFFKTPKGRLETDPLSKGELGRRFIIVPPLFNGAADTNILTGVMGPELADEVWVTDIGTLLGWLERTLHPTKVTSDKSGMGRAAEQIEGRFLTSIIIKRFSVRIKPGGNQFQRAAGGLSGVERAFRRVSASPIDSQF